MIKYLYRKNKDYSRYNIIKELLKNFECKHDIYLLLPFSKNQFIKNFFKRKKIINDFFISNYDTYVYDRQKITNYNPRAWWKFVQDWINFRFSYYLLSDTQEHFTYWEKLFGPYKGKHFILPVLADKSIYYPGSSIHKASSVQILFYGSFIPLHGIDVILRAFDILEKQAIPFQAKIIGNGQTYSKMKQLFIQLNLKNVSMDGLLLNENELAQEIRKSDIILGIFGKSKKAQSVVPNKAYQALASKKVLISMHSKAINEFFSEEEVILCDNTPNELAKNIKELILDAEKIHLYSSRGYERFLALYDISKNKFREFVREIDKEII